MKCFVVIVFVAFMACFVFESTGEQFNPTSECIQTHYSNLATCDVNKTIDCLVRTSSTTVDNTQLIQNMIMIYGWCPDYIVSRGHCPSLENDDCMQKLIANINEDFCDKHNKYVQCKQDLINKCPGIQNYGPMRTEMMNLEMQQQACAKNAPAEQCAAKYWRPGKCNIIKTIACLEQIPPNKDSSRLQTAKFIYGICPEYVSKGGCPTNDIYRCRVKYLHDKDLKNPTICETANEAKACIKGIQTRCSGLQDKFIVNELKELNTTIEKCSIKTNTVS